VPDPETPGSPDDGDDLDWQCYRHPNRVAGVRCNRCDRPICVDCMITAPVGFQCPSCVKAAPPVRTMRSLRRATDPYATYALIGISVVAFVLTTSSPRAEADFGLFGPAVAAGEWWRIVTSGFMHHGILHVGMNMLLLFQLGSLLEPALGRARLVALYAAAELAGALGVLLVDPNALTVGASGAVFGLLAAAILVLRRRGIGVMQTSLGGLLVVNLLLTFAVPGISVGGHVGGLVGGGIAATVYGWLDDQPVVGAAAVALLALAFGAAALAVA
jgi:membrane associated rhomboid family serine protease